jgi:hypothetical protein
MRTIPISAIANQELSVRLDNERLVLRLKEATGVMVADLDRDGVRILSGVRVLAGEPIIPYRYLESGNFMVQTLDEELPDWRKFGVTQSLVYLTAAEVDALK